MGGKKAPPKKTDAEKEAEKIAKASASLLKAAKNDEKNKCEEAITKGADKDFANENGQTAAHIAAAFGALSVIRYMHSLGADFTLKTNPPKKLTPLAVAQAIGEDDAAELISALLEGRPADHIGLAADIELSDDEGGDKTDRSAVDGEKTDRSTAAKADAALPAATTAAAAPVPVEVA